ncbi:MAG: hypothetical protein M1539_05285 [Actinobacteria bacterium]|nr:hypothetical protein [Actinomycetota bacterium]MCL5883373.1 hypothetical protein [Actinomycetota bacterium]
MDNSRRNKHLGLVGLLATAIFACAWLLPASAGIAASNSGKTRVTVDVSDSIGVDFGKSAPNSAGNHGFGQVITELVTQTAPSQLIHGPAINVAEGHGFMADFGLSFGHPAETDPDGAALGDDILRAQFPTTGILVTVINL